MYEEDKLFTLPGITNTFTEHSYLTPGVSQSYCELLDAEWRASGGASGSPLANATHFVSHAWKYDIATVVATLREWVD